MQVFHNTHEPRPYMFGSLEVPGVKVYCRRGSVDSLSEIERERERERDMDPKAIGSRHMRSPRVHVDPA